MATKTTKGTNGNKNTANERFGVDSTLGMKITKPSAKNSKSSRKGK